MQAPLRSIVLGLSLVIAMSGAAHAEAFDLDDPRTLLDAYVRTTGDTSGKPSVSYGQGTVYAVVPGARPQALFGLTVVGVGRYVKIPDGYQRLHREIGFYTDLKTGEILSQWFNPYMQRNVEVIPIQNDPVNRKFVAGEGATYKYWRVGDEIAFYREVPLRYPNPLDRANYPLYSSGDFYEAMEMFNNYVKLSDLKNPKLTSVPSMGSWSRMGPWLPWMEMGQHDGYLLYHSRSAKPRDGLAGIPQALRDRIAATAPKFLEAPERIEGPDETSWTYFKKQIDARRKRPAPDSTGTSPPP
jgi:hypothetical protein